jgi:3-oxoacyl-[acyl-carrier protein] reductase
MENIKKNALVTGGSRGIGRAVVLKLGSMGFNVIINYSSSEKQAQKVLDELESLGGTGRLACFDVSDKKACKKEFDKISSEEKRLDVLIHNAGIRKDGLVMRMKDEDWDRVIDVNLTGFFNLSKYASKLMLKNKWGRIVALSSTSGQAGVAGQMNY